MNVKDIVKTFLILFLVFLLSSCKSVQTEDIIILFTNDVASELNGNVSYAEVKGYKDKLMSEHRYVSLVDAGDFFDGDVSSFSKGKYIVELMDAVGYDLVALGNQEFSIGLNVLKDNIDDSDFIYLSCNMKYLGEGDDPLKKVKPYVIKKYGGTKIAFIGVTTPEILTEGKPSYNAIVENGTLLYDFYGDDEGQELYDQVQKTVDRVRKKVDYVIVIAHLGQNSVRKGYSSYDLIANTTGIDVVIDGHSHTPNTGEAVENKNGADVILTSAQEKLNYLGELVIHPDHTYNTVLYSSIRESDPNIEELIEAIRKQLES